MMKPERWRQVDQLFRAALERAPEERAAFIGEACGNDHSLRGEVEALLAADGQAGSFIETPAYAMVAPLLVADETPSLVGRSIGHYQVISLVGKGGMGKVYRARDTRLDRTVALKILLTDVAADDRRLRRFLREAKAASALNHPNVAHIYEIGEASTEAGSVSFIAMEYIEGQTLAARINAHPLAASEIVEIGSQITDALVEAHDKGITHRDIKPTNVMFTPRGQVKVLDFGLAKITQFSPQAVARDISTMAKTASGVVMGTVPYMSPEQALGREVDYRSDLFSLGVVLYEMATGRLPFSGANMSETLDRILHAQPEAMARFNYDVPAELERIVRKCLEKERERRYQSARELLVDLQNLQRDSQSSVMTVKQVVTPNRSRRWLLIALAVMLLVFVGTALYLLLSRAQPKRQAIKSLAVLPLENLSADPAQEYFVDGMTEALISKLTQVRALRVISRTSVMRFKGSRKSLAEVARELNVDAVIEGSVQRDGGRVKITARLIQVENETLLRSFDYERELADVLKLQSEVAGVVAHEIRTQVTAEERARLASTRRVNPAAHDAYLLGRSHLRRQNEADLKLAIGHFERATQLDTDYAAAWAGLSIAWLQRGFFGTTTFWEVEQPAREAALKAIAADANSAEGYTALAMLKHRYQWDWAGAEHDFRRAIELNPGSVEAHRFFAFLLSALGRHAEAISEIQTAEQLDPLSSLVQSDFGVGLYRARNYEQAERYMKRAIELDPLNDVAYYRLGYVYGEMGRYADAIANLVKAKALQSNDRRDRAYTVLIALMHARMGRREEALRILKDQQRTTDTALFPVREAAAVWIALGNKDEAFKLLFSAVEKRATLLIFMKIDPLFDSLHSDPRWKELLRPLNFPEERHSR
jgi:eukaryotic-like serine/threonine-protein kinase